MRDKAWRCLEEREGRSSVAEPPAPPFREEEEKVELTCSVLQGGKHLRRSSFAPFPCVSEAPSSKRFGPIGDLRGVALGIGLRFQS